MWDPSPSKGLHQPLPVDSTGQMHILCRAELLLAHFWNGERCSRDTVCWAVCKQEFIYLFKNTENRKKGPFIWRRTNVLNVLEYPLRSIYARACLESFEWYQTNAANHFLTTHSSFNVAEAGLWAELCSEQDDNDKPSGAAVDRLILASLAK